MSRYIDADEFWNNRPENLDPKRSEFNRGWVAYAKAIRECLDETPTADVVEVRHGHWIEDNKRQKSYKFICSECGGVAYSPQPNTKKPYTKACAYKYCPHCAADMRGKNDDNT